MNPVTGIPARSRTRARIAGILAAVLLAVGAVTAAPPPAAHADSAGYDQIEVYKAGVCPPNVSPMWFFASEVLGAFANPLVGFVLGPAWLILPFIGAISGLAAWMVCTGTTKIDTMQFVLDEIERQSQTKVDETLAARLKTYTSGLGTLILEQEPLLDAAAAGQLSDRERNDVAGQMQLVGNRASLAMDQAVAMGWQSMTIIPILGAVESQAYLLAAWVSPGSEAAKQNLTQMADQAKSTMVEAMRDKENSYRSLMRQAKVSLSAVSTTGWATDKDGAWVRYVSSYQVEGSFQEGGSDWKSYDEAKDCVEPGGQLLPGVGSDPYDFPCNDYDTEWQKAFAGAQKAYQDYREGMATAVPKEYLAAKAAAGYYATYGSPGEATHSFQLVNNLKSANTTYCIGVENLDQAQAGDLLETQACNQNIETAQGRSQVWDYIPGTAILRNVSTGLCVNGDPTPADEGGKLAVSLDTCPADPLVPSEQDHLGDTDDHAWGMHPLGYLVNLESGRCLDPRSELGSGAQILDEAPCTYDLPSTLNGLDAPQMSGFSGFTDGANDQVWNVRPAKVPVTIDLADESGYTVTSDPDNLSCDAGGSCTAVLEVGTQVTVSAARDSTVADDGSVLDWSGPCTGSSDTCTFTVGLDKAMNTLAAHESVPSTPTDEDGADTQASDDPSGSTSTSAGGASVVPGPAVLAIVRVHPRVRVRALDRARAGGQTRFVVSVAARGMHLTGRVRVQVRFAGHGHGRVRLLGHGTLRTLRDGQVVVKVLLPRGKSKGRVTVRATYTGSSVATPAKGVKTVKVVRRAR